MSKSKAGLLLWWVMVLVGFFGLSLPARAYTHDWEQMDGGVPAELRPVALNGVGVDEKLGTKLSPRIRFTDELGKRVSLGRYLGKVPIILVPVYYHCPHLCSETLKRLTALLRAIPAVLGQDYRVIAFSFDPKDKPARALGEKRMYLARYVKASMSDANPAWHFLTGTPAAIRALTGEIGFRYRYDKVSGEYSHAAVMLVLTPEGRISRYLSPYRATPLDLRVALLEASHQSIGSLTNLMLLYCFHYDPTRGKYGALIMRILRILSVLTIVGLGGMILVLSREVRTA